MRHLESGKPIQVFSGADLIKARKKKRVRPLVVLAGLLLAALAVAPAAFMFRAMRLEYPHLSVLHAFAATWSNSDESAAWGAAWIGLFLWSIPAAWKAITFLYRGLLRPDAAASQSLLARAFANYSLPIKMLVYAVAYGAAAAPGLIFACTNLAGLPGAVEGIVAGHAWSSFGHKVLGYLAIDFLLVVLGVRWADMQLSETGVRCSRGFYDDTDPLRIGGDILTDPMYRGWTANIYTHIDSD